MILRSDLLTFRYYKKEKFTGSFCGMRYLIKKETEGDAEIFAVFTWPGPYNFETTRDEDKKKKTFPFTEASLDQIADYLNCEHKTSFSQAARPEGQNGSK